MSRSTMRGSARGALGLGEPLALRREGCLGVGGLRGPAGGAGALHLRLQLGHRLPEAGDERRPPAPGPPPAGARRIADTLRHRLHPALERRHGVAWDTADRVPPLLDLPQASLRGLDVAGRVDPLGLREQGLLLLLVAAELRVAL